MKRIVICCDGTWNEPFENDSPTNVVKTVRAICPADESGVPQVVYYDTGVGTGNAVDRLIGGGLGAGLSRNVQEAYLFLVSNYQEGDEIYMFGFSRGAYTVRSVSGLVGLAGILSKRHLPRFRDAYRYYRTPPKIRSPELKARLLPTESERKQADIHFLGVWDTVGALGIPFGPLRFVSHLRHGFHDVDLGSCVRHAYHALAIDERRRSFAPALWTRVPHPERQKVEQIWFSGVHSNVGGGYPNTGLSDIALRWMLSKAADCGLFLDWEYVDEITCPRPPSSLYESRTWKWKLRRPLERKLLVTHPETERIHESVLKRASMTKAIEPVPYAPSNLKPVQEYYGDKFDELVWRGSGQLRRGHTTSRETTEAEPMSLMRDG